MKKNKRIMAAALVCVASVGLLSGCSQKELSEYTATKSLTEIATEIQATQEFAMMMEMDENALYYTEKSLDDVAADIFATQQFAMTMNESDPTLLKDAFGFDTSTMAEYSVHIPMMVSSNLVAIARANSADDVAAVQASMQGLIDTQIKNFEGYLPDQLELAKTGQVVTKGLYVMAIIAPTDVDAAITAFEDNVKTYDFGLDLSNVSEYVAYTPVMTNANTIVIAKANDEAALTAVTEDMQGIIETQQNNFENYLPDQYEIAKGGQVVTKGLYVMAIIAPTDVDAAVKVFDDSIE